MDKVIKMTSCYLSYWSGIFERMCSQFFCNFGKEIISHLQNIKNSGGISEFVS